MSLTKPSRPRSSARETSEWLSTWADPLGSPRIERLFTGSDEFLSAWERFQKFGRKPMSFTDCVSLAHMEKRRVERMMSFDSEFEGLTTRIH